MAWLGTCMWLWRHWRRWARTYATSLRPYQHECVNACLQALEERGLTRIGVSAPTGSGKTTMFLELVSRLGGHGARHALILVNGITLAQQAAERARYMFPHMSVEMDQGARHVASGQADITVGTVQSLRQRLAKYDPSAFKCVIVDEAHHSTSPSYQAILSHFHCDLSPEPVTQVRTPIIGFSATFTRHDGVALGRVYEEIVYHKDFLDLMSEKWLCPIRFTLIRAGFDLSRVSSASGDYVPSSLARVVNQAPMNEVVVRSWIDLAWQKRRMTLVFAVDVAHVHALVDEFRARGIDARGIHGGMSLGERDALLQAFREHAFPVLVNCAILTEGADIPAIDCVWLVRPTKSRNLFSQMIGRGMRQSVGKQDCLIVDVAGNVENDLACTPTLCGLDVQPMANGEVALVPKRSSASRAPASFMDPPQDVAYIDFDDPEALRRAMSAKPHASLASMSPNAWVDCGADTYVLGSFDGAYVKVRRVNDEWQAHYYTRNAAFWRDYAAGLAASSPYLKRKILTSHELGHAIRGSDTFMKQVCEAAARSPLWLRHSAYWRRMPATAKSRAFLAQTLAGKGSRDVSIPDTMSQGALQRTLIRLRHGSKALWRHAMKRHNRRQPIPRDQVQVGPL